MIDLRFRPVDPAADGPLLHGWLTHPKSAYWLMQQASLDDVRREFADQQSFLGLHEDRPAFLMQRYDPAHSELVDHYPVRPGDVGMHFLVAPADRPIHGFTRAVMATIMEFLFADPATARVVVEPDITNDKVLALNEFAGFRVLDTIALSDKKAYLSICTRSDHERACA
jgi:RimJ/RimL family protein N-acetyltransferase